MHYCASRSEFRFSPGTDLKLVVDNYVRDGYAVFTYKRLDMPVDPCRVVEGPTILARLAFAIS